MKIDASGEISSVKTDTLLGNYAYTDYLSSYTATLPFQGPSVKMTKIADDPFQSYPIKPHPHCLC